MAEKITGPAELTQEERIRAGYDLVPYRQSEHGWNDVALGGVALMTFIGVHLGMHVDKGPGPRADIAHPAISHVDARFPDAAMLGVLSVVETDEHHIAHQNASVK